MDISRMLTSLHHQHLITTVWDLTLEGEALSLSILSLSGKLVLQSLDCTMNANAATDLDFRISLHFQN